mmetsp:Transcript_67085/g.180256  ORF Transcript_67085/g.180256 Transcript_67085/m.180256 type:complete len:411 (-) Transcript_67085:136-1368(-)
MVRRGLEAIIVIVLLFALAQDDRRSHRRCRRRLRGLLDLRGDLRRPPAGGPWPLGPALGVVRRRLSLRRSASRCVLRTALRGGPHALRSRAWRRRHTTTLRVVVRRRGGSNAGVVFRRGHRGSLIGCLLCGGSLIVGLLLCRRSHGLRGVMLRQSLLLRRGLIVLRRRRRSRRNLRLLFLLLLSLLSLLSLLVLFLLLLLLLRLLILGWGLRGGLLRGSCRGRGGCRGRLLCLLLCFFLISLLSSGLVLLLLLLLRIVAGRRGGRLRRLLFGGLRVFLLLFLFLRRRRGFPCQHPLHGIVRLRTGTRRGRLVEPHEEGVGLVGLQARDNFVRDDVDLVAEHEADETDGLVQEIDLGGLVHQLCRVLLLVFVQALPEVCDPDDLHDGVVQEAEGRLLEVLLGHLGFRDELA